MKKLLSLILALALCLTLVTALVACGDGDDGGTTPPATDGDGDDERYTVGGSSFSTKGLTLAVDTDNAKMWIDYTTGSAITLTQAQSDIPEDYKPEDPLTAEEIRAALEGSKGEDAMGEMIIHDVTVTGDGRYFVAKYVADRTGLDGPERIYCTHIASVTINETTKKIISTIILFSEADPARPIASTYVK